ncbi:MAG: 16S rRNA (cytosine(1402)-N(4))-methyltransferase [Acidobacteria bacterium]|nr:MAG: 16S rRNA (cytosine(1402)-N(4))-methyltransferase [Acidobacteriota bacterium]PYS07954.1 MAG: 16S rRNA (cytosine(1402)-N(4))-methyltransferase [Acidobacteriota bacterium]
MLGHTPVLAEEVIQFLDPRPGGRFIDVTVGAGGHSRAILELTAPDGKLLAIDQDESALKQAREALASFAPRVVFLHSNFRHVAELAGAERFSESDGVLADIGISSMMVEDPSRGFSFMHEGPLDMRMDRTQPLTAADVLNTRSEKDIADILYNYGEERRSRPIARSIVRARPLETTTELVRAIERVTGGPRYGRIHPATRTFQALRIFVNDELRNLEMFVDSSMHAVRSGGRIVVITFHSLEDRIVKQKFRAPAVPGRVLTKKVVTASEEELQRNPRSRSAKLRAWERS